VPILYLARKYMMFRYNYESFSEKTHPWWIWLVTGDHDFMQQFKRVLYGGALLDGVSMGSLLQHPRGLFLIVSIPSPTTIPEQVSFEQALRNSFGYKLLCYIKPTCILYPLGNEGVSSPVDVNCYITGKLLRILKSTIFWDITPCNPLSVNRHFGGTYHLHLQGQRNKFSKKPAWK
jgi:hypothetical protein